MFKTMKLFFLAVALLMLPLTGYTMSYNQGFVDGVNDYQQALVQTEALNPSTFAGESEADLFHDDIVFNDLSEDNTELSMADAPTDSGGTVDCMATTECYQHPEVGWYIF